MDQKDENPVESKTIAELFAETETLFAEMQYGAAAGFMPLGIESVYDSNKAIYRAFRVKNLYATARAINENLRRLNSVLHEISASNNGMAAELNRHKTAIAGLAVLAELIKEREG